MTTTTTDVRGNSATTLISGARVIGVKHSVHSRRDVRLPSRRINHRGIQPMESRFWIRSSSLAGELHLRMLTCCGSIASRDNRVESEWVVGRFSVHTDFYNNGVFFHDSWLQSTVRRKQLKKMNIHWQLPMNNQDGKNENNGCVNRKMRYSKRYFYSIFESLLWSVKKVF